MDLRPGARPGRARGGHLLRTERQDRQPWGTADPSLLSLRPAHGALYAPGQPPRAGGRNRDRTRSSSLYPGRVPPRAGDPERRAMNGALQFWPQQASGHAAQVDTFVAAFTVFVALLAI